MLEPAEGQLGAAAGPQLDGVDHGAAGMLRSGRLLPGLMSALAPDSTTSPCDSPAAR